MVTTIVPKVSGPFVGHVTTGHDAVPAVDANPSAGLETATSGPLAQVSGEAHSRFVIVTTLLSLIDRVRGEPTTHSLDRHPHDDTWRQDQLQKKFLDSFALISSTSKKGGETASAVCLEQGHPSGNILRLARNRGIPQDLVFRLQEVLEDLTTVALRENKPKDLEDEILRKIIALTKDKVQSLLQKLDRAEVRASIHHATDKISEDSLLDDTEDLNFKEWVRNLPLLVSTNSKWEPSELVSHIKWASRARWIYSEQLEMLFGFEDGKPPPWLKYIYKLGRYYAATKAMLKLAVKQPHIFTHIHIAPVKAPEPQSFSLGQQRTPLVTIVKKITKADPGHLIEKLGQTWLTNDPEERLRRACRMMLTVHAEMQLLSFYDHNPHLTPRLLFMGTSKKACYLCHEFMSRHPLTIGVSASHQKLYPTWMPAPCSSAVRKRHKVLLWEFSRHLEQTTARDLETRLGIQRRPFNLDSTAGPSLTTTGTVSTGFWFQNLPLSIRDASEKADSEGSDRE
ncbi:hypothetical protein KVR01_009423 [Diaporthe batatas]|uniref:uncharacterized protein n=1 Tax=Diaporthe batatas TaxID=748121 RepID=UPI001D041C95|nr:uncharacterized protein KVR01_009423 [Diaporthe batatas]KAG8161159.1 hypothetical protein KVR01_009423 [Diaporthe batatas]